MAIALLSTSCSTLRYQAIPRDSSFEMSGKNYFVTLKNGRTISTRSIRAKSDTISLNDTTIQLTDIKEINIKKFSIAKTAGLAALFYLSLAVIAPLYLISLMNSSN